MQDFDRLIIRLRQFGGMRLLWQYLRMGVLWTGIRECFRCIVNGRSLKYVYPAITRRIDKTLTERYSNAPLYTEPTMPHAKNVNDNVIWFCWLQGMENAPDLVHACHNSILTNLPENSVVIITADNYHDYVTLPDYIERKYHDGIIPHPLFSDILRLFLLIHYGGTWIDASVLCTGKRYWQEIQSSELFLFRYFKDGKVIGTSNWFIHAKPNNPVLRSTLGMLLAYWRDYNCTVEYYIFHLFFSIAARKHPELIKQMPRGNSFAFIQLGQRITQNFDLEWWNNLTDKVSFHKLNYRQTTKASKNPNSYYNYIVNKYGNIHSVL